MANDNGLYVNLNAAMQQATGDATLSALNWGQFIDEGADFNNFNITREQFTKALIEVIFKNVFTDTVYTSAYKDPFYKDEAQFGAIMQRIHVELPTTEASLAWKDFSLSPTVGTYTVSIPVCATKLYDKSSSWQVPLWISLEQLDSAFHNLGELETFASYLKLSAENAVTKHLEIMNEANRNTFIARKLDAQANAVAGIHAVNLVAVYQSESGTTSAITVDDYLNSKDMLIHGASTILKYKGYMRKMLTVFNVDGYERFTPDDRMVLQVLDFFEKTFNSVARSSTFHDELIALPNYQGIPFWQGFDDGSFASLSTIDIDLDGQTTINQSGIVAFLCDSWAIGHTIKKQRVASKVFEPENLEAFFYQFRDSYYNDLSMNAVVFYLEDVAAVTP